eukprot:g215.t1 g215   contig1:513216-517095(-)
MFKTSSPAEESASASSQHTNTTVNMSSKSPPSYNGSNIQVVVRLRPMNETERRHGTLPVVTAKTQDRIVTVIKGKGKKQMKYAYSFDNVFTAFSTQEEVFEETVKPVICDVMRGFESTVFAYGQTGTGKTHTMEGSLSSPEYYGVIPRSAQAIFEHLKQPQYKEQVVTCSYLEIYNEELRDLLDDSGSKSRLEIMEGKDGTFCRGLTERQVNSAADVLNLMQKAQHSRIIGETKMNKASSRSHCLFTIQVHGKIALIDGDGDMEFNGKLHMVDLAGSECAKSAGNDKTTPDAAARERERMNINRSLLTLGRVITTLKERSENKNANARIPYRDSKLTRILQESLGGRCKTVIVATLSPSITAIEESVSTLNYAQSANGIINKPISSSLISLGPDQFGDKAEKKGTSIESWQEMEMRLQYMQTQVEEAQAALARKHLQQQELQDRAEKAEADLLDNQQKLYDANVEIKSLKGVVETETKKRKLTEKELHKTQLNLKKTYFILKATQATESSLTAEAQTLIGTLEDVITERNEMHALVVSQRDIESERRKATQQFQEAALTILNSIESSFAMLCTNIDISQSNAVEAATLSHSVGRQYVSETQQLLADIAKNVSCVTNSIRTQLVGEGGIVSGVNVSSESILASLKSASTLFAHGEASFDESSEAMRMRLDECAKTMDERASSIQSSTAQTLQSFEAKVTESRNTIGNLVMRVKSSLQNLAASKAKKTKEMDSLVEQWRDQSLENSRSVLDATSSNCESFKSSIATFQNEMHHHDKITKSLESQRSFADFYGAAHVQSVEQQSTVLNAHREKLAECHNNQTKLRNEVMQSILSSVQSVVTSEIEKLATAQLDHFQLLDEDGADLVATNEKMTESAKQVMENIQSTNQLVSGEASVICNNDLKASEAMKSTQSTLERVIMSSNAQLQLTTDFASKSVAAISDMKQLDTQNPQIVQMVERDGHACSKSLVNTVLKPTCLGVKKTVQSGLDAMAYVNNIVVRNINGGLDDIVVNRKAVATEMAEKIDSANSQLVDMKESVASMAKAGSDAAGFCATRLFLQPTITSKRWFLTTTPSWIQGRTNSCLH